MRCPEGVLLVAWVDDEVDPPTADRLDAHVDGCDRCLRLVRGHRLVKRRTSGLSTQPEPVPNADLVASLLTLPAVEHTRAGRVRRAHGTPGASRLSARAVGAGVGAGLVALAWFAPLTSGSSVSTPPGTPPGTNPAEVPSPTDPVSVARPASTASPGSPSVSAAGPASAPAPARVGLPTVPAGPTGPAPATTGSAVVTPVLWSLPRP